MKFHNPFCSNSSAINISLVATMLFAACCVVVLGILFPKVLVAVVVLALVAGTANIVKYLFTGKGFVE